MTEARKEIVESIKDVLLNGNRLAFQHLKLVIDNLDKPVSAATIYAAGYFLQRGVIMTGNLTPEAARQLDMACKILDLRATPENFQKFIDSLGEPDND